MDHSSEQIESKVIKVIAGVLNLPPAQLSQELMMGDIEEWDSLNHILIIHAIEVEFNIVFDLDQIIDAEGICDLVSIVSSVAEPN